MGETSSVKPTTTFLWVVPCVKATDHKIRAPGDRKKTRAVGNYELKVETDLHSRKNQQVDRQVRQMSFQLMWKYHRRHFLVPRILQQKPTSHRAGGKHSLFTHFPNDANCQVCRRPKVTRAPCRRNPDEWADRIKIPERFGDMMTGYRTVLIEEQESRIHHKNMQWLCKTWQLDGFKVNHAKRNHVRR